MNQNLSEHQMKALVLAAGKGTRMGSEIPKPLHLLCGQPMANYVIEALAQTEVSSIVVVVGYQSAEVKKTITNSLRVPAKYEFVEQEEQLGTAHATSIAIDALMDQESFGDVLITPGDMPLLRSHTLSQVQQVHTKSAAAATLLTADVAEPDGYGRIVRDEAGDIQRIVEHRDASATELAINEVNTSVYCFDFDLLATALHKVESSNSQSELYLTDVIEIMVKEGQLVTSIKVADANEVLGVNDLEQLAKCEDLIVARQGFDPR